MLFPDDYPLQLKMLVHNQKRGLIFEAVENVAYSIVLANKNNAAFENHMHVEVRNRLGLAIASSIQHVEINDEDRYVRRYKTRACVVDFPNLLELLKDAYQVGFQDAQNHHSRPYIHET